MVGQFLIIDYLDVRILLLFYSGHLRWLISVGTTACHVCSVGVALM